MDKFGFDNPYTPSQAHAPTPQLHNELLGDCMNILARETVAEMLPLHSGSTIIDVACGTGAGTAALVAQIKDATNLSIKGVEWNEEMLATYAQKAKDNSWPAEAIHQDVQKLSIADDTFSHAIGTAVLSALPRDAVPALREVYRTLKPGGVAVFNSWAHVPNMEPIRTASRLTRPQGSPLPRDKMKKWEDHNFLRRIFKQSGFEDNRIAILKREIVVTTTGVDRYAGLLWSFLGGSSTAGWLAADGEKWEEAVAIVKEELVKSDGYRELEGGKMQLKFVANVIVARK
ncbi:unnamed protein product [Periconia digitata]|uniref:Methyltransferase domain-containing protein n=1 Tax=Periconia digitata TaxID=1303443 RepID=A0A9W4UFL3_9PLEO|nr:unnamed protein product [Periconia digitata]